VVIAGDFNDGPGIGPLEKRFALPDTIGLLEMEFQRSAGDEKTHEGGFNIDHVMVYNARASKRTVVPTPWSLSDHRPVWVTISFD
jgi:endonuclease/exonuclease/phosphatase family metal-dependent hydrolase